MQGIRSLSALKGTLSYDSKQVTLSGTKQKIAAPWAVEFNENRFVAYDNNQTNPIQGSQTLFVTTFRMNSVAPGTSIKISCTDVKATGRSADVNVGIVTYSATVAEPLSSTNKLTGLTVSNAEIAPAFRSDITSYTAKVPFSVSKLNIKATGEEKTTVSISNPILTPGGITNVVITVKAENGAKKTYTIKVTREQDPSYQPSSNNKLSGISVEGFLLSPVFHTDTTRYIVWLPYETQSIKR